MDKIQISQLAWAAKKNKDNLDMSMGNMAVALENLISAMATVDPVETVKLLEDVKSQVEKQSKSFVEDTMKEKGDFVEKFLNNLPEDEVEEISKEEVEKQSALGSLIPHK